jgi:hypothetical protein
MTVDREAYRGMGSLCCGPWFARSHSGFRLKIGTLLLLIGLMWFGARMGWFDFTGFPTIPFWPAVIMMIGAWMIYRGWRMRRAVEAKNDKEA